MILKYKILYVDDESINVFLFANNFKKKYDVLTASNGMDALKVLEENPLIDIVISDFKMPQMDGVEFIRIAKASYPEKKYYILSGFDMTEEIKEALDEGIILGNFSKPISFEDINHFINKSLEG